MKRWLFSAPVDLAVFGGTAVVALVLVGLAPTFGIGRDAPEWSWITGVLLVDVAHVWSTTFVVYLDPVEWKRRPMLYGLTPVAAFAAGVALYASGGPGLYRSRSICCPLEGIDCPPMEEGRCLGHHGHAKSQRSPV